MAVTAIAHALAAVVAAAASASATAAAANVTFAALLTHRCVLDCDALVQSPGMRIPSDLQIVGTAMSQAPPTATPTLSRVKLPAAKQVNHQAILLNSFMADFFPCL